MSVVDAILAKHDAATGGQLQPADGAGSRQVHDQAIRTRQGNGLVFALAFQLDLDPGGRAARFQADRTHFTGKRGGHKAPGEHDAHTFRTE